MKKKRPLIQRMGTGEKEPQKCDDYQTPASALYPLLPYLKKDWCIWEPACGQGNLVRALSMCGFRVFGSDILTGRDFTEWYNTWTDTYDMILTNPPFSKKDQFLECCYDSGKPFALLLKIDALEGQRQWLYTRYGLELILPDHRVNYETPDRSEAGCWFYSAWFTWGLDIGRQMTFQRR